MYLGIILILMLIVIVLSFYIYQSRKSVQKMNYILEDILNGNLDRKLIAKNYSELNNLLQNVLIHSQADLIKLEIHEIQDKVCISLVDNGIGISGRDLPHIFERLYRCDLARSGKGNGLGLAIVNELVKANKGRIHVESEEEEGSSFILEFQKQERNK